MLDSDITSNDFWSNTNIPFPSKSTRQRRKCTNTVDNGVITHNLKNMQAMCKKSKPIINSENLTVLPVCLSRDAMAIKPSGDFDPHTNKIIEQTFPIDFDCVKDNPNPDPDILRESMYSEAGAVIATALYNSASLLVANDFLVKSTSGLTVYSTLCSTIDAIQICTSCLQLVRSELVTADNVSCQSVCIECVANKNRGIHETCDDCSSTHSSPYPQLRACARCVATGKRCFKLTVMAVSMDCESNNALAMKMFDTKASDSPPHTLLVHSIPDVVYVGKKVFRASANWWLWLDNVRMNNSMLRTIRQFDTECGGKLKVAISDSSLRNRDRMDYTAILESTSEDLHLIITNQTRDSGSYITHTLYPDLFWKSNNPSLISSTTDICLGKYNLWYKIYMSYIHT